MGDAGCVNKGERRRRNANVLGARANGGETPVRAAAVFRHSGGGENARRGRGAAAGVDESVGRQEFFAPTGRGR